MLPRFLGAVGILGVRTVGTIVTERFFGRNSPQPSMPIITIPPTHQPVTIPQSTTADLKSFIPKTTTLWKSPSSSTTIASAAAVITPTTKTP